MMNDSTADLLVRARAGDSSAWETIVQRYAGMLAAVVRSCGLPDCRGNDVIQTTWMRLFECAETIRDAEHLGGWLKTVARREAWRTARAWRREVVVDEPTDGLLDSAAPAPDEDVMHAQELDRLRVGIALLPERQRMVLHALVADPPASYTEIAELTGMPIGSIGPTRARALDRLRRWMVEAPEPVCDVRSAEARPAGRAMALAGVAS